MATATVIIVGGMVLNEVMLYMLFTVGISMIEAMRTVKIVVADEFVVVEEEPTEQVALSAAIQAMAKLAADMEAVNIVLTTQGLPEAVEGAVTAAAEVDAATITDAATVGETPVEGLMHLMILTFNAPPIGIPLLAPAVAVSTAVVDTAAVTAAVPTMLGEPAEAVEEAAAGAV